VPLTPPGAVGVGVGEGVGVDVGEAVGVVVGVLVCVGVLVGVDVGGQLPDSHASISRASLMRPRSADAATV